MKTLPVCNKAVCLLTVLAILSLCAISAVGQVSILQNSDGAGATGWAPPDPNAAVGPNNIVQAVNNNILFFNKSGTLISQQTLNTFFNATSGGDPHVIYNEITGRYALEAIWDNASGAMVGVCFAVSDTSDPTGSWHKTFITVPGMWDGYGGNGIGYNADAYVVHVNGFNNQFAVVAANNNVNLAYTMVTAPSGVRIGRPAF